MSAAGQRRQPLLRLAAVALPALLAAAACTVSNAHCTAAGEFEPRLCDAGLPAVRSVVIEHNAVLSALVADRQTDCSDFVLDPATVRRYFARTRRVDDPSPEHAVDWAPCQANGSLRFVDGRHARWRIDQIGGARLSVEGKDAIVLYCPDCAFPPFRN